jgi:hypothetical protein
LGYELGYARIPNSGIAHPIAVRAPVRAVNSISRPAVSSDKLHTTTIRGAMEGPSPPQSGRPRMSAACGGLMSCA